MTINPKYRRVARLIVSIAFLATGTLHFLKPSMFARIVPPSFPHPNLLVLISGLCEIAGGVGLQIPRLRKPAACGLIALLIAVFPANIYMAVASEKFGDLGLPAWAYWARLPFQLVFIAIVWWVGLRQSKGQNQTPSRL